MSLHSQWDFKSSARITHAVNKLNYSHGTCASAKKKNRVFAAYVCVYIQRHMLYKHKFLFIDNSAVTVHYDLLSMLSDHAYLVPFAGLMSFIIIDF